MDLAIIMILSYPRLRNYKILLRKNSRETELEQTIISFSTSDNQNVKSKFPALSG